MNYSNPQSDRIVFYFDDADRVSSAALERQSITGSDWVSTAFPEFTDELEVWSVVAYRYIEPKAA